MSSKIIGKHHNKLRKTVQYTKPLSKPLSQKTFATFPAKYSQLKYPCKSNVNRGISGTPSGNLPKGPPWGNPLLRSRLCRAGRTNGLRVQWRAFNHAGFTVCVHQDVASNWKLVFLGVWSSNDTGFGQSCAQMMPGFSDGFFSLF
jgi:hypothetical protein